MSELNKLILLVEDNKNDELLALRAFKKADIKSDIDVARDGAEAMDYLFSNNKETKPIPELILLDLNLPKINGLEVLKRLKSDHNTSHIPVIVMTSSDEGSDVQNCYLFGANSYIRKPVDFQDFLSLISKLTVYWLSLNQSPGMLKH